MKFKPTQKHTLKSRRAQIVHALEDLKLPESRRLVLMKTLGRLFNVENKHER